MRTPALPSEFRALRDRIRKIHKENMWDLKKMRRNAGKVAASSRKLLETARKRYKEEVKWGRAHGLPVPRLGRI